MEIHSLFSIDGFNTRVHVKYEQIEPFYDLENGINVTKPNEHLGSSHKYIHASLVEIHSLIRGIDGFNTRVHVKYEQIDI